MFQVTNKIYQLIIAALIGAMLIAGIKIYVQKIEISQKAQTISERDESIKELVASVAVQKANNTSLSGAVKEQGAKIKSLEVDIAAAKRDYKIVERAVTKTIDRERIILRDINDSEDWNNTKRIIHEIIAL